MRLASSAFLRRAAAMSSSYSRRGYRRPGRGYSARPSPPPPPPHDAVAELVSGDSHLSAVRAANDSLRRDGVRGPPPPYWQGPQEPPYSYGYGYEYGQPQQRALPYGSVPYNYGHPQQPPLSPGPQYGYGAPNPYVHWHPHPQPHGRVAVNAGFRPGAPQLTPRLADYRRRWRFAQQRPPHQAERFKVLSYNILADYLAQEHRFLYERIPSFILDWNWRKNKLVFEFGLWSPDILCLQEVDKFADLEEEMSRQGYNGIWKMRTGSAADGCAIFWRTSRFHLRYEEDIEFNKLELRDNVAQMCVLESVVQRNVQTDSTHLFTSPSDPQQAKQVVVCNIHVLYNPKRGDIKLGQVRTLLDRAYTVSKMWNDAPVILCGDFNSTPKSPLYNFVFEQKLNLSGLAKSTISGQHTSASPQGLYTGPNISRFHPPFYPTNNREGNVARLNDCQPQTETTKLVESSCPESSNNCGNKIPCSASTNLDGQGLLNYLEGPVRYCRTSDAGACANITESEEGTTIDKSSEEYLGVIKIRSGEEPDVTDGPSAPATVCGEILQSGSSKIASDASFRPKDSVEELVGGSKKVSNTHKDLPGELVSEEFACAFEGNGVQSDDLLAVSKDNPNEREKVMESMLSGQDNCTTSEPESSPFSGYKNFADALHQMSNVRLDGKSSCETTHLTSPAEPAHQPNGAVSDACGNQCTPEEINKYSVLCRYESESNALALEDDTTANELLCTDVNADPSFFEEFSGGNDRLLEEEDQLPAISDGSPSSQQVVTSSEGYNPCRWTTDEIKVATGSDDCTSVEHNLKLRSVYTDVEDFEGTKDANKEPLVTSYNRKFMGTVDYIWASEGLQTVQVLDTFPKEILKQTIGFPTKKWGSDHIALVCELAFTK